jgi:uncharacterized protein
MKAYLAGFLLLITHAVYGDELAARVASVPNPRVAGGWVADPAGVIAKRSGDINQLIAKLEADTSTEIAVVVLPTIGTLVPKDFAVALVEKWGVGKAGKDNGLLMLHILDQQRFEIETGYGMEGVLPDAKLRWIREEIGVPYFKKASYADGHYEMVRALVHAIRQPDIKHSDLIAQRVTEPGATTDKLPSINSPDAIALEYASAGDRVFYSNATPLILFAIGVLIYLLMSAWYRRRSSGMVPYAKYQLFNSGVARLQYAATLPLAASAFVFEYSRTDTFFAPLPVLLVVGLATLRRRSKFLRSLRDEPRTCSCGKTMRRLDEREDDAYIEKGNVAEESIGSMDYDVWVCECGQSAIESYQGKSPAAPCTQCHYRTYRATNTRTLYPATTIATGMREITHTCANCNYTKVDNVVIPVIATSSNRSGGSSGRSGGSFGGGRSGGGGGGSSY